MSTRIWEESEFQQEHLSDILRSLTLNKYGGLYLDLDVIMLKPLRYINLKNFLCKEKTDALASCIYRCNRDEGRVFTEKVLKWEFTIIKFEFLNNFWIFRSLSSNYNPNLWAANGPELLTSVAFQSCPGIQFPYDNFTKCDVLDLIPTEKCFPLSYDVRKISRNYEIQKNFNPTGIRAILWGHKLRRCHESN